MVMDPSEEFITDNIKSGVYLRCNCGSTLEKDGGCNYVQCPVCKLEWCWECRRVKYIDDGCKEAAHNSH